MSNINVFDEYIDYTKKSTMELLKLTLKNQFNVNIYNELFDTYKKARYYNSLEIVENKFLNNITYHLRKKAKSIIDNTEKKKNFTDKLTIYINMLYLDDLKNIDIDKYAYDLRTFVNNKFDIKTKNFEQNFIEKYNEIKDKKKNYLKQFNSRKFEVKYYITNFKKVYNTSLEYNFKIPSLYSEKSINKVYNTGIIAEEKLVVYYYTIASKILNNTIEGKFDNHYIIDLYPTLLKKEEKLKNLFKIIDNSIIKNQISFKIYYSDYVKYKSIVDEFIYNDYNFSLILDNTYKHNRDIAKNLSFLFKFITVDISKSYYNDFSKFNNIIKTK